MKYLNCIFSKNILSNHLIKFLDILKNQINCNLFQNFQIKTSSLITIHSLGILTTLWLMN